MIETRLIIPTSDLQPLRDLADKFSYRITEEIVEGEGMIRVTICLQKSAIYNLFYLGGRIQLDNITKIF